MVHIQSKKKQKRLGSWSCFARAMPRATTHRCRRPLPIPGMPTNTRVTYLPSLVPLLVPYQEVSFLCFVGIARTDCDPFQLSVRLVWFVLDFSNCKTYFGMRPNCRVEEVPARRLTTMNNTNYVWNAYYPGTYPDAGPPLDFQRRANECQAI
jgi:hypothetical protein